jgi:hypothetical protein
MIRLEVELALDRSLAETVALLVQPLDEHLQASSPGCVRKYATAQVFSCHISLALSNAAAIDEVLEFLADAGAAPGTLVYRKGWFGRKKDIHLLGPD